MFCLLGATYLCEQSFPVMSINKTKLCLRLTRKNLKDVLYFGADQDLMPDIAALVKEKKRQVSGTH